MVNKVWVAVVPNTKNFASDLRKFLARVERTLELIVDVREGVGDRPEKTVVGSGPGSAVVVEVRRA